MKGKGNAYKNIALITQLGISMMTPIFLCVFVGVFVDNKFNIHTTLPLLILGILAGGRNTYKMAISVNKDDDHKEKKE